MRRSHVFTSPAAGSLLRQGAAIAALLLGISAPPALSAAGDYETPPILEAADLLDPALLKGDHYEIEPQVTSDGFMNHFTLRSDFGTFEATSQAMVRVLIHEVQALSSLKELSRTEVFIDALTAEALRPLDTAFKVAADPVGAVTAVPAGVERMFRKTALKARKAAAKAGKVVKGGGGEKSIGKTADETARQAWETGKDLAGFNGAKRALARRVEADPYSANKVLQDELDRLAWAAFLGEVGIKPAVGQIPLQGEIAAVSGMVWDLSPSDLEVMNRERLGEMGADGEMVDLFFANPWHTPTVKTAIVELLSAFEGTEDRMEVLDLAILAGNREESLLFVSSLRILSIYHSDIGPVKRIASGNLLPWGVTGDGTVVIPAAVDHIVWTEAVAETARAAGELFGTEEGVERVELRIAGTVSDRARQELQDLGWTLTEGTRPGMPGR